YLNNGSMMRDKWPEAYQAMERNNGSAMFAARDSQHEYIILALGNESLAFNLDSRNMSKISLNKSDNLYLSLRNPMSSSEEYTFYFRTPTPCKQNYCYFKNALY